jgi:hypothetical protein
MFYYFLLFLVLNCNWSCLAVVKHLNKLVELLLLLQNIVTGIIIMGFGIGSST